MSEDGKRFLYGIEIADIRRTSFEQLTDPIQGKSPRESRFLHRYADSLEIRNNPAVDSNRLGEKPISDLSREMGDWFSKESGDRHSLHSKLALKNRIRDTQEIQNRRNEADREESLEGDGFRVAVKRGGSIRDIEKLAGIICGETERDGRRVSFYELNLDGLDDESLRRFKQAADDNKRVLEANLRERIRLKGRYEELRVGLAGLRVYVWKINRTPDDMLNVWGDRYFYFKKGEYATIIDRLSSELQLPEEKSERAKHLNELIRNMISEDATSKILHRKARPRLIGDFLHFIRDTIGVDNAYFEGKMTKVTSRFNRGAIDNPKLPTGQTLEILRAKLGAVVNSDCWIGGNGIMWYYEGNVDRIRIVEKLFQQLGDIKMKMAEAENNTSYRMLMPRHIGRAFIYWGFTTDDKSIRNQRLVESIREGAREVWSHYLRELIPEDGSFNNMSGFQWSRSIVLNPGRQDEKYGVAPKLNASQVSFIKENGRHDKKRGYIHLQLTDYLKAEEESKTEVVKSFKEVVSENRCKVLDDEAGLAENLGIGVRIYPECITLYEGTGRVSIKWVATTQDAENTIRWCLIAMPDDIRKRGLVQDWLAERPDDVERVRRQLEHRGLLEKE